MTVPPVAAVDWGAYLVWCLAVMGVVILLGIVLMVFRTKVGPDSAGSRQEGVFSIEALEAMRQSGQIDEAEFKALRRTALGLHEETDSVDNAASSDNGGVSMNGKSGD